MLQECGTEENTANAITSGNARTIIEAWNFQKNKFDSIYDSWKGIPYTKQEVDAKIVFFQYKSRGRRI